MEHKAKNLTELFHSISQIRSDVFNKTLQIEEAESMNNSAGKMIKIAALQASICTPEEAKEIDLLK